MKRVHAIRWAVHSVAATPVIWIAVLILSGQIGPDPAETVVRDLGFWALVLLWSSLAMTPLRYMSGGSFWVALRRPLGLWSFAYASLHLAAFLLMWAGLDLTVIADEVRERPYILLGASAWVFMIPLALTSTRKARMTLGHRWTVLHRAVYVVALLALLHLLLVTKLDYVKPLAFAIALIFLFFLRIINRQRRRIAI